LIALSILRLFYSIRLCFNPYTLTAEKLQRKVTSCVCIYAQLPAGQVQIHKCILSIGV